MIYLIKFYESPGKLDVAKRNHLKVYFAYGHRNVVYSSG